MSETYRVVAWVGGGLILETTNLNEAKRVARAQGHDGTHNSAYYAPVALVVNLRGEAVYNPRFKVPRDQRRV